MTATLFLEPLDVLYLRGNKLFGGAGDYSSAMMPPWPSIAAGAIRSRMLVDGEVDLKAFAKSNGSAQMSQPLQECLGSPAKPGDFRVVDFTVARKNGNSCELFYPCPADLFLGQEKGATPQYLSPTVLDEGVVSSAPLPQVPALVVAKKSKPKGGVWLNQSGWKQYLKGGAVSADGFVIAGQALWDIDPRVGNAICFSSGAADDGKLYSSDTIAMYHNIGFAITIQGADGILPQEGLVRFGGDGRGAEVSLVKTASHSFDASKIKADKRFKLLLTTPAILDEGWQLPLVDGRFVFAGENGQCSAKLVAACVSRGEVVSGWDLANRQPKPAQRVAPTGSVYFLEQFDGTVEDLKLLEKNGLPFAATGQNGDQNNSLSYTNEQRRAEGFNNLTIASWSQS